MRCPKAVSSRKTVTEKSTIRNCQFWDPGGSAADNSYLEWT